MNYGGIVFRWVRDQRAVAGCETAKRPGIEPYEILARFAEGVPPDGRGLLCHPFLAGERAPLWSANRPGTVAVYQRLLPIFLALPAKLEPEYRAIAAFQREHPASG